MASHEVTEALFDSVVGLNFKGPFRLASQIAKRMSDGDGGVIINVTSSGSLMPLPGVVPYGGAKAALNAMSRSLAAEYGPKVRVNTLSPGPFLTDISKAWTEEARERNDSALGRPGQPEEIVTAALFLASPASSFTTGAHRARRRRHADRPVAPAPVSARATTHRARRRRRDQASTDAVDHVGPRSGRGLRRHLGGDVRSGRPRADRRPARRARRRWVGPRAGHRDRSHRPAPERPRCAGARHRAVAAHGRAAGRQTRRRRHRGDDRGHDHDQGGRPVHASSTWPTTRS